MGTYLRLWKRRIGRRMDLEACGGRAAIDNLEVRRPDGKSRASNSGWV